MRLCLCAATLPDHTPADRALQARTTKPGHNPTDRAHLARNTELDHTPTTDRALKARTTEQETLGTARIVEEAVLAASKTGFRCLEMSLEAVEDYLAVYPLVVLDAFLAEYGCHIGATSGFALDADPTDNETGRWSLLQARFLEVCTHLDGLGGGILTLGAVAGKEHVPTLRALSALAQPYDVQLTLECGPAGNSEQLSPAEGADLLHRIRCPNVGLAYTVDKTEITLSQQAQLDEFASKVLLWRCPVSDAAGIRSIVKRRHGLCSIKPPAGLNPLEAARAAAAYAASIGFAPTETASPNRQT